MTKQKLQQTSRADLKKKIDLIDSTSKNVKYALKKKAPLKAEISVQLKELKEKYDNLEQENDRNIKIIKNLESKVIELEKNESLRGRDSPLLTTVSVQTDKILSCHHCDYTSDDVYEFDQHRWTEHEDDDNLDDDFRERADKSYSDEMKTKSFGDLSCNLCVEQFQAKRDLMKHKKTEHSEQVANCWKFAVDNCHYGDDKCWFKHLRNEKEQKEIKCHWCEKVFQTQCDFLKHKKQKHKQFVPKCRNSYNGKCSYREELCWFIHDENSEGFIDVEKTNENQEVFEKIFGMMEKITERVMHVEKGI